MNFATLIPSWVFIIFIIVNVMLAGVSVLLGLRDLFVLNVLSGISCYIGYVLGKKAEEEE